jgi:cytochrome c oxidase accessory protein FixG
MQNELPQASPPKPDSSGPTRRSPVRPPAFPAPDRDSVTTIRSDGSRAFLFPADAHGRFATARQVSAFFLIALYLSLPWIDVGGYPAVFLDLAERRFHLFGITLAAQDLWLLFFLITGLGFSLFFVTAFLGRVWCGWACPHTVFLDHVYRRIERWIDGDAVKRRALDLAPLTPAKFARRALKHGLYVLVSAVITHLLLAYFVSLREVWEMITHAPTEHWSAFAFMVVATGILYFNFAWFREQLCIVICPYGRIQSALIDDHSLVVGYDTKRGEPRGKAHPADGAPLGDCVACNRCVQVCPTGIDIRQGLQMECVGCTACIDACDDVMTRLARPRGLIRYDSQNGFAGKATRWIRPRTLLYFVLLLAGVGVATWALSTVRPANLSVTRMTGAPYVLDPATVRNQFLVRIVNKRAEPATFVLKIVNAPATATRTGFEQPVVVAGMAEGVQPLILQTPRGSYAGPFKFVVRVEDERGRFHLQREVEFLGPDARLVREAGKE